MVRDGILTRLIVENPDSWWQPTETIVAGLSDESELANQGSPILCIETQFLRIRRKE